MKSSSFILCTLLSLPLPFSGALASDATPEVSAVDNSDSGGQEQALERVREELNDQERRWYALGRVRWSYPQKFSAGFGAIIVDQPKNEDCSTVCMLRGWHFEIEPGLYGIQGSVGWGKLVGTTGRTKRLMHSVHFAWAVRGVVMRTWGNGPLTPQSQTLAGIEGSLTVLSFNFSLGLMRSMSSTADDDWVAIAGLGLGF